MIRPFALLLALAWSAAAAPNPYLVQDLDPLLTGVSSQTFFLKTIGSRSYFAAETGTEGMSLWTTEGTAGTTIKVAEFAPGVERYSEFATVIGVLGSSLVYATDAGGRYELQISDGTAAGTRVIMQFGSLPFGAAEFDGKLYFSATTSATGSELWRTDGTTGGTTVLDLIPGTAGAKPFAPYALGNRLYFYASSGPSGAGLYRTDGTVGGTSLISAGTAGGIVKCNNRLVFVRPNASSKSEYWVTDGTPEGTTKLTEVDPGTIIASNETELFFSGNHLSNAIELWSTDGTVAGTRLRSMIPIVLFETVHNGVFLGSSLIFSIDGALFVFKADTLTLLKKVDVREHGFIVGGVYYFSGGTPEYGQELWRSDGTAEGTRLAFNLAPGKYSGLAAYSYFLQRPDGALLLADDGHTGQEPWFTADGTRENTRLLANIKPEKSPRSGTPRGLQATGGRLFFDANDETALPKIWSATRSGGTPFVDSKRYVWWGGAAAASGLYYFVQGDLPHLELWRTDGTPQGTLRIYQMPDSRYFGPMLPFRDGLLFVAGFSLYFTDGTVNGTRKVIDAKQPINQAILASTGLAWFSSSQELYRTDGSNTLQITLPNGIGVGAIVEMGGDIYFLSQNQSGTFDLWRTSGTEAHIVKRIEESLLVGLRASNTHLFLLSPTKGVIASDGTDAATKLIVPQGAQSCLFENPRSFVTLNGIFYWIANASGLGGLWRSDGTAEGTYRLVQWTPAGLESCDAGNLIVSSGKLFFRGKDAEHGIELWVSDGTAAGTRIAADVAPGTTSSNPSELTLLGDTLFFRASTPETGEELFAYDTFVPPKRRSARK